MDSETKRIQFDFRPQFVKRMDDFIKKTDITTKAELVRKSLNVYIDLYEQASEEGFLEICDKEGNSIRYHIY